MQGPARGGTAIPRGLGRAVRGAVGGGAARGVRALVGRGGGAVCWGVAPGVRPSDQPLMHQLRCKDFFLSVPHTVKDDPFIESQRASTQSSVAPHVVFCHAFPQNWGARSPRNPPSRLALHGPLSICGFGGAGEVQYAGEWRRGYAPVISLRCITLLCKNLSLSLYPWWTEGVGVFL